MNAHTTSAAIVVRAASRKELERVLEIYRSHKAILGLLPKGAFEERLAKKQIYVAKINDKITGYVLFSINQSEEVRIAHLATDLQSQRGGVASALINKLKVDYSHCSRIRLNCRADFPASAVWPRLGFVAVKRLYGRKASGSELIAFQYRLNDSPLFDQIENAAKLPIVVCDANICWDIEYSDRDNHEASSGLLVDWLADEIELRVTEEILNDIDRQESAVRDRMRSAIRSQWEMMVADPSDIEFYRPIIQAILGKPSGDDDLSDEKHLAIAAAGGATAFATRDFRLLEAAPEIFSQTGMRVQRPSEIITEFDSLQSATNTHFGELRKTGLHRKRVKSVRDVDVQQFVKSARGEKIGAYRCYLDHALSNPKRYRVEILQTNDDKPLALVVVELDGDRPYRIHQLRIARRLDGTRLGRTLIEYMSHQPLGSIWSATKSGPQAQILSIVDPHLSAEIAISCLERGFRLCGLNLSRSAMPGLWTRKALLDQLDQYAMAGVMHPEIIAELRSLASADDEVSIRALEKQIHPGKAGFGDLPTWIIPIKPEWAQELFDFRIWPYDLFPAEMTLVVNPDSVYYKRPRNSPTTELGRILWYVSGRKEKGGNLIRACSAMTKRVTGSIKNLFRQYERMGVFDWKQIKEHFGDANAEATAIEFTDTELLPNPISFDRANEILTQAGMKPNRFQSALRVPAEAFELMYRELTKC